MKVTRWAHTYKWAIICSVIFLAVGVGAGTYLAPYFYHSQRIQDEREFDSQYQFISPLLACSSDLNLNTDEAADLQTQMQETIKAHEDANDITMASVYFKDLNGGPYVAINYEQPFSPGSLLKVPLAMSIYKESETDPTVLQKQLTYTADETDDPQFFAPVPLTPGKYTVDQLITQMLVQSDNNAANVLATFLGVSNFEETYEHIGVPVPPAQGTDYTTTTQQYGAFFSVLYNATYLSDDDSEHLLSLLSQATFKSGLVAGVPSNIVVAHKFGERSFTDSNLLQLHDCGIVYAPNHPYLLCIMTQGYDYPTLTKVIAQLSNLAYNYVE